MGNVSGLAFGWIRDCDDLHAVCQVFQLKTSRKENIRAKGKKGISANTVA